MTSGVRQGASGSVSEQAGVRVRGRVCVCVACERDAWAYVHVRIRTATASKRRLVNEIRASSSQQRGVKTIIAGRLLSVGKASRERLEHEFYSLRIGQPSQFTASKRRGLACRADAAICHEFFEVPEIR